MRLMDPVRYEGFKASGRLPSPKGVALAIIRLLRRDEYKVAELVQLLQSDPAAAGRLIKFANSAAMSNTRPIVAIAQAVVLLGAYRVRDVVLGFSLLQDYCGGTCKVGGDTVFDYQLFWSRSLAAAIAAQALAKHAQIAAEECFTLGLLCDIGKLSLAAYDCSLYGEALRMAAASATPIVEVERTVVGADHRELGAALMAEWGLPENMVLAAYYSEEPDSSGFLDGSRNYALTLSLYFARALADVCVAAETERWGMLPELYATAARLGIAPDELTAVADDVVRRWREWGATLEIQTQGLPPFAELLSSVPPPQQPAGTGAAGALPPRRHAVVVGAKVAETSQLGIMLETLGYEVRWIDNGVDGLMVVLRDNPEIVFVDVDTPELDGESFCRAFRASPLSREAYLVLIGNADQEEQLGRAVDTGADDILLRPISKATLRLRLRAADRIGHLREAIRQERRGLVRSADKWAGSQRRMMDVALTDPLTRLPNRRRGLDFLAAEWVFAHTNCKPLSCMMVDVDHFKNINDLYGHDVGDTVLTGVAKVLAEYCRSEDMAFRYGGEEFCVVCIDANIDGAYAIAERIRGGVELERHTGGATEISVTASIGVASNSADHADAEALVKAADAALYRAKQNGRNRVEILRTGGPGA